VTASRLEPVECAAFTQPKLITADVDVTDAAIGSRAGNADDVSGYLASYYAQTLGHGRPDCPWTIAVRPGLSTHHTPHLADHRPIGFYPS